MVQISTEGSETKNRKATPNCEQSWETERQEDMHNLAWLTNQHSFQSMNTLLWAAHN